MVDEFGMPREPVLLPEATLSAAKSGDSEAVGEIWRAWNPRLLRFLVARRVIDPDDLASTIWIDVAAKLPDFEGDGDAFRRWLFTVAYRRIIDDARKRARQVPTSPLAAAGELESEHHNEFSALGSTEWAVGLLRQLNEDQATAVALRILADMSVAEVAEVMGRSAGSIRTLTHRGTTKLRELIDTQTETPGQREIPKNNENVVTLPMFQALTPDA